MREGCPFRLLAVLRRRLSPKLQTLLDEARLSDPAAWPESAPVEGRVGAGSAWPLRRVSEPEGSPKTRFWVEEIRARSEQLVEELRLARELLEELCRASPEERLRLVETEPRYILLPLLKHLLAESRHRSAENPEEGESLARTALAIAERLGAERYERSLRNDFQAQAWTEVGNARRMAGDHAGAEQALRRATDLLRGTRDSLELARLLNRKAALRKDQRRLDEAIRLRERALRIYRQFGDVQAFEQTLAHLGEDYVQAGQPQKVSAVRGEAGDPFEAF